MPDFERVFRSLELHSAQTEDEKKIIQARHDGQDQARREMVGMALFIAGAILMIAVIAAVSN